MSREQEHAPGGSRMLWTQAGRTVTPCGILETRRWASNQERIQSRQFKYLKMYSFFSLQRKWNMKSVFLNYLWACLIRAVTFSWLTAKYVLKRVFSDVGRFHRTNLIKVWFKPTRSTRWILMTGILSWTFTCGRKHHHLSFLSGHLASLWKDVCFQKKKKTLEEKLEILGKAAPWHRRPGWLRAGLHLCSAAENRHQAQQETSPQWTPTQPWAQEGD